MKFAIQTAAVMATAIVLPALAHEDELPLEELEALAKQTIAALEQSCPHRDWSDIECRSFWEWFAREAVAIALIHLGHWVWVTEFRIAKG